MQRKKSNNRNGRLANASEKAFQGWLKEHDCVISGTYGVEVHHCVGSTGSQDKVHIGHYFCLPLSTEFHKIYHSNSKEWREEFGLQSTLWSDLVVEYEEETGEEIPLNVKLAIIRTYK